MTRANGLKAGLVVAFSIVGALAGRAETLTWTGGGGDNKISTAANWNPQKTPVMGDRLVSSVDNLKFAAETIELTGAGLTFAPTKKIYFDNTFAGDGPLTIDGSNVEIVFDTENSHTGGTIAYNGMIKPNATRAFGTGPLTLHQASATRPYINTAKYAGKYPNDIVLYGNGTAGSWVAINDPNLSTIGGSISSDCDFTIQNTDRGTTVMGGISAPGRTVTLKHTNTKGSGYLMNVQGAINANVIVQAADNDATYPHSVQFEGVSTGIDNSLTIESGTNLIAATGSWAGTNVTVKSGGTLFLKAAGNLSANAELTLEEGAFLVLGGSFDQRIARLVVSGKEMPIGVYKAATLPGTISGSGTLTVTGPNASVWVGAAGGSWNVADNWSPKGVPGAGSTAVFENSAELAVASSGSPDTVEIADGVLTVWVKYKRVNSYVAFTGNGKLKIVLGDVYAQYVACTHVGGTEIRAEYNDTSYVVAAKAVENIFGSGDIDLYKSMTTGPCIWFSGWGMSFTSDFHIHGAITNTQTRSGKVYGGSLYAAGAVTLNGNIDCDDDLMISTTYGSVNLNGTVSVPDGKSVYLQNGSLNTDGATYTINVNKVIDGDLVTMGAERGSVIAAAASVSGTNIIVRAPLALKAAGNLAADADVMVEGGMIDIPSGVKVQVARFFIDGIEQRPGTYTKSNCSRVVGDGKLRVGNPGLILLFR